MKQRSHTHSHPSWHCQAIHHITLLTNGILKRFSVGGFLVVCIFSDGEQEEERQDPTGELRWSGSQTIKGLPGDGEKDQVRPYNGDTRQKITKRRNMFVSHQLC